jgi:hypothetical protein
VSIHPSFPSHGRARARLFLVAVGATTLLAGAACTGEASGGGPGDPDARPPSADAPPGQVTPDGAVGNTLPPPEERWKEHWFEHDQNVELVAYNDDVAIYFDDGVDRTVTAWMLPFLTEVWQYTRRTYGEFGDDRLYNIFHQGRYGGGHPSTYFDESHDNRNVSDCGGDGDWDERNVDVPTHEIAHIVEFASRGVHGSPAFGLWGDSKWAEIYQYDLFVALGRPADAERLFERFTNTSDDFPRAGTHWFRDWYFPIWRDHGKAAPLARFFVLLSQHFPKNGRDYARDLNFGEYVHFMSGAAGADLEDLATDAFGASGERDAQLAEARRDFPGVTY